jgi:uncharacterized protein YecE (DUF72 family)
MTSHPIDVGRLPADLKREVERAGFERRAYADRLPPELAGELERRFLAVVDPVHAAGKLGCVMAQFPPWFRATRGNARRLEALAERFAGIPVSIEFRHPSWLEPERRERVFDLLESHQLIFVGVDEPDVPGGGVPPVIHVTNPELAIVRLHGKNAAGWRRAGASVQGGPGSRGVQQLRARLRGGQRQGTGRAALRGCVSPRRALVFHPTPGL